MIAGLKPYSAMKDSGVPWLGEVPEHWDVRRLRNLAEMRVSNVDKHTKEDEHPVRLCNYVDVYKNDYIRPNMNLMRATATREEIERFRLSEGDVLITKDSEAWNDIGVPALVRESADDLISGYHLALLRPFRDRIEGEFLFRSLQSTGVQYQFHVEANGVTRYGLSHAAIKSVWLPEPPLPEQAAIVRFLDHADRRIRRYIRAKQRLIKLLEEQKQAIIHRAVTRGLDPNVRLKPSGVEWLGDVPEHWKVRRLKYVTEGIQMGPFGASLTDLQAHDTGYKLYGQENTISGDFSKGRRWVTGEQFAAMQRYELLPGDLVLTRKGSIGKCKMVPEKASRGIADSDTIRVRLDRGLVSDRFVVLLLQDATYIQRQIESVQRGAILAGLNTATIGNLRLAVPPVSEQTAILARVEADTAALSHVVHEALREIALLREYRTRLIADVVTGKLDVREAAARLPDAGDEPEPLDEDVAETDAEEAAADDADAATAAAEA